MRPETRWIDITLPLTPSTPTYEGEPPLRVEREQALVRGDAFNVSVFSGPAHAGTHVDAPVHVEDGAAAMESLPLDALIGPAAVLDATALTSHIGADALRALRLPAGVARVLFKTRNSALYDRPGFQRDFIGLLPDAAHMLVEAGVRLVAMDYISVAPADDPIPTHRELLLNGVVILEGVDLRRLEPGEYDLVCLPLLLVGSDGSPARSLLRRST